MDIRSVSGTSANRLTASPLPEAGVEAGDQAASGASASATAGAKATGVGGYISPFLRYDQGARVAVLLFRDVDTGETQDQIPSQRVVEEYRRTAGRLSQPTESDGGAGGTGRDGAASASGSGGAGAGPVANRGMSFASFGASGSSASSPAAGGSVPLPAPPTLAGAGGGAASPGGLVSVTV